MEMEWKVNVDDIQGAKIERAKVEALRAIAEQLEKVNHYLDEILISLSREV